MLENVKLRRQFYDGEHIHLPHKTVGMHEFPNGYFDMLPNDAEINGVTVKELRAQGWKPEDDGLPTPAGREGQLQAENDRLKEELAKLKPEMNDPTQVMRDQRMAKGGPAVDAGTAAMEAESAQARKEQSEAKEAKGKEVEAKEAKGKK